MGSAGYKSLDFFCLHFAPCIWKDKRKSSKERHTKNERYVLLMPWVGLGMFVLSFPVLWWNERRHRESRAKAQRLKCRSTDVRNATVVEGLGVRSSRAGQQHFVHSSNSGTRVSL